MRNIRNIIWGLLLFGCSSQPSNQTTRVAAAMFRGDPQHTGVYTTKAVHQFKEIKWAHKTNDPARSSPAVTNDVVYLGSGDGFLYAVDLQSDQEKWRCKTESAVHS